MAWVWLILVSLYATSFCNSHKKCLDKSIRYFFPFIIHPDLREKTHACVSAESFRNDYWV